MKFSVLTASFCQLGWLKRCVRSVADQSRGAESRGTESRGAESRGTESRGAESRVVTEHLIQDGDTGPELEHWVRWKSNAGLMVMPDRGMYDALNKAFRRVTGDVFSILNCDEQYLPGALEAVQREFEAHPEADIVVGDCLLLDEASRLIAYRRSTRLRPSMILTDHLYDFTCTLFFRSHLLERGIRFDTSYRAAGDADWLVRLLHSGVRVRYLRRYLSTFTILADNLSLTAEIAPELAQLRSVTPRWALAAAPLLRKVRHVEKLLAGGYTSGPIEYEVYASDDAEARTFFRCEKPGFRHPWA